MKLTANFHPPQTVTVEVNPSSMGVTIGSPVARDFVDRDPYTGSYEVTPTDEEQILSTRNLRMTDNVVVRPIPQNYGKITWNGSFLTVS